MQNLHEVLSAGVDRTGGIMIIIRAGSPAGSQLAGVRPQSGGWCSRGASSQRKGKAMKTESRIVNVIFWFVVLAVILIAAGSFALSFTALHDLARQNGQPDKLAWIWPVIVDISLVIYTVAILVSQLQRRGAKLPITLTIAYGAITITGNILHAPGQPIGYFVAALPPISLILGTELLRTFARHQIERKATLATLADLVTQRQEVRQELDSLTGQVNRAAGQLDQLRQEIKAEKLANLGNLNDANNARQVKKAQAQAALLDYLDANPYASQAEVGQAIGRSKTTVGNYIDELTAAGKLYKNGNGFEVVR